MRMKKEVIVFQKDIFDVDNDFFLVFVKIFDYEVCVLSFLFFFWICFMLFWKNIFYVLYLLLEFLYCYLCICFICVEFVCYNEYSNFMVYFLVFGIVCSYIYRFELFDGFGF